MDKTIITDGLDWLYSAKTGKLVGKLILGGACHANCFSHVGDAEGGQAPAALWTLDVGTVATLGGGECGGVREGGGERNSIDYALETADDTNADGDEDTGRWGNIDSDGCGGSVPNGLGVPDADGNTGNVDVCADTVNADARY